MTERITSPPSIAVLVAAITPEDGAMQRDQLAMIDALRQRGVAPQSIMSLSGALDRSLLLDFFRALHRKIAKWEDGSVFLHIGSHGYFVMDSTAEDASSPEEPAQVNVGLELQPTGNLADDYHVLWDELFQTLALPATVKLTLLPDH